MLRLTHLSMPSFYSEAVIPSPREESERSYCSKIFQISPIVEMTN